MCRSRKPDDMSKTKINKSALIRDLLRQHKGKQPLEIAAIIKSEHGLEIPPQYISSIKSNMRAKRVGRKILGMQKKRKGAPSAGGEFAGILPAAVQFIKTAGGLDNARAALDQIAEAVRVVG